MSMELEMATCPFLEGQLPKKEADVRKAAELRDRVLRAPLGVLGQGFSQYALV